MTRLAALLRAASPAPLLATLAAAVVVVLVARAHPVAALQFCGVALASVVALSLRDPAAALTAASPTPLWWRRAALLAGLLPVVAVAWAGLLGLAGVDGEWAATLTLELAAFAAIGLAVAAYRPALAPATVVAAFAAAGILFAERLTPAAGEHGPTRLAAVAIGCAALAAYAHGSRDWVRR